MDKKTYIRDSAHDHRKAGVDNGDHDPWFYETCKLVNIACDKFWTMTAERVRLNELYYKSRWGRI